MSILGALFRSADAMGRLSDGARTRTFIFDFSSQEESKKFALMVWIQVLFSVYIAWFVLMGPTGLWGSGVALPRGSADSAPASCRFPTVAYAIHCGIMAAVGSVGMLLPGVRGLLANQHGALWDLVWNHHRDALLTNPAATEQQSIRNVRERLFDSLAMLQPMADWGPIAGAVLTLCHVIAVWVAPMGPLNLAINTIRCGDRVLGWVLLAVFGPFTVLYIVIYHFARKAAFPLLLK